MPDIAPQTTAGPAVKGADVKPLETKSVAPGVQAPVAPAAPAEPVERWFNCRMAGQSRVVNVLALTPEAALERFKRGEGIRSTPHEISIAAQADDYQPTAADLDHHGAIEAAAAAEAKPRD